jgi:hypothetical protein
LFLQVAASLHVAEQARNLDPACPIRYFIGSRTPFVVVRTHDLGRLLLVDPLCGLEEALAQVGVDVRRGYLRLAAKGRMTDEDLDEALAELEETREAAQRELETLKHRRERISLRSS